MAPMLGPDGLPLAARHWYDAESLAQGTDGVFYVGIERVEKIVRYRRDSLRARGQPILVPTDFKSFTYNKSLGCLAAPPKGASLAGALIVVTERSLDAAGIIAPSCSGGDEVTRFSVKRANDYDVSDCTFLPPADMLLLERRYSPLAGVGIRIRQLHLADIREGVLVDGPALFEADLSYQIDNIKGIGLHSTHRAKRS